MLQPVAATMPHWSPYFEPVAAAHHAQRRPLAAAGAGAGPAGVECVCSLSIMSISRLSLMYLSLLGPDVLEVAMALAGVDHHLVGLGDHLQSVVVADGDALGAALALARVDDDLEHAAGAAPSSCRRRSTSWSSTTAAETSSRSSASGMRLELLLELGLGQDLAEDGRVGALGHAVHAAGAVLGDVLRDFRRDVAEVAERGGAGRDQRAGQGQVGRQVLLAVAFLVAADDALVEVDARPAPAG